MPPPPPPPARRDGPQNTSTAPNKEENAYIPSFISKRPFYAGEGEEADYLEHQRLHKQKQDSTWYDRGKKGTAATKYRKGACENCGAMGHKVKDCLERPRKKGAKFTGKNIQADDVVQDVQLSWDAKRDRWNGYDPKNYKHIVEEYNQMEELRREMQKKNAGEDGDDAEDAGDKYAEESDMSKHQPTSTRQLRIREDTAKYLLNLDLESAKYDPKTRTLVDAGATADKAAELFAEEGFVRASGDAAEFEKATRYAWEAQENKGDTSQHLQANPTAGEFYRRKEREEAERKRLEREAQLREMYGDGAQAMPDALKDMTVTENEHFIEYDEHGLVKGAKASAKSKYPEDIYINNHTSVWGSWWASFQWGYECCHSTIKNSYCTGEDGKRAWEASERQRTGRNLIEEAGEAEVEEEEAAAKAEADKKDASRNEKQNLKRTREEMASGVTEEEMDEYRRKRTVADDPMAKFLGKDELV
ncbi:Pre-mRNA-splicing factor SLU7 [Cytospora mali]|uniref:Pre-mRNA-splicing factor SLU7 n=1 Tax=Cytospora mali TaxID=578113 RepID=A0A194UZF2_CYTMA|nr:Pre-mRNA-splicing factor SLU7 [Valsa mali var. pyri (nom. inval.)]